MKYIQIEKEFWRVWKKDPEWMIVNKAGRVVKVDDCYTKEMLEKEIKDNIRVFRYLAKFNESAKWLQVNSPEKSQIIYSK